MTANDAAPPVDYLTLTAHERRQRLIAVAIRVFIHDDRPLTLERVAAVSGAPSALVEHLFRTPQELLTAGLAKAVDDLGERLLPYLDLPPHEMARRSILGYLEWADEHLQGFRRVARAAIHEPAVRELLGTVRTQSVRLILGQLHYPQVDQAPPPVRIAATGWLSFASTATLCRIELGEPTRAELAEQLLETLVGAIRAAGDEDAADRIAGPPLPVP